LSLTFKRLEQKPDGFKSARYYGRIFIP